jgi:hypothetical protein
MRYRSSPPVKKSNLGEDTRARLNTARAMPAPAAPRFAPPSLPPQVKGDVQGHCIVTVEWVRWGPDAPPVQSGSSSVPHVRAQWWGEDGVGTLFRPPLVDDSGRPVNAHEAVKEFNQVTFPVCCAWPRFLSYLKDAVAVTLIVFDGSGQRIVGTARISTMPLARGEASTQQMAAIMDESGQPVGEVQAGLRVFALDTASRSDVPGVKAARATAGAAQSGRPPLEAVGQAIKLQPRAPAGSLQAVLERGQQLRREMEEALDAVSAGSFDAALHSDLAFDQGNGYGYDEPSDMDPLLDGDPRVIDDVLRRHAARDPYAPPPAGERRDPRVSGACAARRSCERRALAGCATHGAHDVAQIRV